MESSYIQTEYCSGGLVPYPTEQPEGFPFYLPTGVSTLPVSQENQLLILKLLVSNNDTNCTRAIARSYDGHAWEVMPPAVTPPACDDNSLCSFDVAEDERNLYRVDATERTPLSAEKTAARLLRQGTFRPSRTSIQDFVDTYSGDSAAIDWVEDQMNLPATLFRTYYRQRSNPRRAKSTELGATRPMCEPGSCWHSYAFDLLDEGETLVVAGDEVTGVYTLRMHGMPIYRSLSHAIYLSFNIYLCISFLVCVYLSVSHYLFL